MVVINASFYLLQFLTGRQLEAWVPVSFGVSSAEANMHLLSTGADVKPVNNIRYICFF